MTDMTAWLRDAANYVVLDTETTGLYGQVIELGIVTLSGAVLLDERIRPTCLVEPGAFGVHGISDADVAGCRSFDEVWQDALALIAGREVITYNAAFDRSACARSHTSFPEAHDWLCAMEDYAPRYGNWNEHYQSWTWASLAAACRREGVQTDDLRPHSAVGDALATARLIHAVAMSEPGYWMPGEKG